MKLSEIVADIRNISTSGSNPIEFRIEEKQIIFWINEMRSLLISQALDKRKDISDVWVQSLSCLQLEQVDESDCCDVTTGCHVLRTVKEIPQTIEVNGDNSIIRVTNPHGIIIPKGNAFSVMYNKYNKFANNKISWYIKNKRIYLNSEDLLETINVFGLFENPMSLKGFSSCSGTPCFTVDSEYPCSLKMATMITDIVVKTKVLPFLQLPSDNSNDAINKPDAPLNPKGLS